MDVLIIEDEKIAANNLERMLLLYDNSIRIKGKIDSVKSATKWLEENDADLIFVDVHLADDTSFKIFEKIQVKTPLIFTTAYDEYAIKAFKLNSIDYLLKPIDEQELANAIDKFKELKGDANPNISELLKSINADKTEYQKRFIITQGEKIKSILVADIAYFYSHQKYVLLVTNNNDHHFISFTMEKLETQLDPEMFFRINRKFFINFYAIRSMTAYSKSRVKIYLEPDPTEEAIVSIDKAEEFKRWLNR
jgi:two-component system, LytTR family, response regulator LytT